MWNYIEKNKAIYLNSLGKHVLSIYRVTLERDKFKWVVTIWKHKDSNDALHKDNFRFETNSFEKAKFLGLVRAKQLGWLVDDLKI